MSGYLSADIRYLLVTQMTLLVPFLTRNIDITNWWRVQVILDQLPEASDYVFESAARNEEVILVFGVEEGAQRGQNYRADVEVPDCWSALYYLSDRFY